MSLKQKCTEAWENTCDTAKYACHSPLSFTADAVYGVVALGASMFDKEEPMRRLYRDRCKHCAKFLMTGLVILSALSAGCHVAKHSNTQSKAIQSGRVER